MTRFTQLELDKMLKSNTDLQLHVSLPRQAGKTKRAKAVQAELALVSEKLYHEKLEYREMELSESRTQSNFFIWIRANSGYHPQLASFFAVPNGGFRNKKTASILKGDGLMPGIPDTLCLHPAKTYAGIAIEFKVKYNKPSQHQVAWLNRLATNGFYCAVCWSQRDAMKLVCWFYSLPLGLY